MLFPVSASAYGDKQHRRGPKTESVQLVYSVYDVHMARTNIEIDDLLIQRVMARFGVHTKREAVDLALRHVAGQPMTIDEALQMRGAAAIDELPPDTAP